jgi:hypothetical protein
LVSRTAIGGASAARPFTSVAANPGPATRQLRGELRIQKSEVRCCDDRFGPLSAAAERHRYGDLDDPPKAGPSRPAASRRRAAEPALPMHVHAVVCRHERPAFGENRDGCDERFCHGGAADPAL